MTYFSGCVSYYIEDLARYKKNGIQYGVTDGTFRPRWWSYYERGRSFADGEFWTEAEHDLRKAISIRSDDDRRARTYGLHYTQYFGNRELGFVLYRNNHYKEAIQYLKKSLTNDPSEKAKFYLNECQQKLSLNIDDKTNPVIVLEQHVADISNSANFSLSGKVQDNLFVDHISINDNIINPVLKASELVFNQNLVLNPGNNRIEIVALDSKGNSSRKTVQIILDLQPPLISISSLSENEIIISVDDDSPVNLITKNLRNLKLNHQKDTSFSLKPIPEAEFYYIEVEDAAHNKNGIRIDNSELKLGLNHARLRRHLPYKMTLTQLASSALSNQLIRKPTPINQSDKTAKNEILTIEIEQLGSELKVYQSNILVSGKILGKFKSLRFDNELKLKNSRDTRFCFNKSLQLGDNKIELLAIDHKNKKYRRSFNIERLHSPEENRELRATVILCPLAKSGGDRGLNATVYNKLLLELHNYGRFRMLETKRLDLITIDKNLTEGGWIDTKRAANFGRKVQTDYSLACTIRPSNNDIEIFGRLIDTETSEILATCDVYELNDKKSDISNIYSRFTRKLSQHFPIIEKTIAKSLQREVIINAGQNSNIKKGMKFVAFHREKPLRDSKTGQILVKGLITIDAILSATKVGIDKTRLKGGKEIRKSQFIISQ